LTVHRRRAVASGLLATSSDRYTEHMSSTVLIAYGTNSGNTEYAAETIAAVLTKHHFNVTLKNVQYIEPSEVLTFDLVILGCCTWEKIISGKRLEGQLQDQMERFCIQLHKLSLAEHPMAVFALGDSDFQFFCNAGVILNKFVDEVEAYKVGTTLYIDSWPQPQQVKIEGWAANLATAYHQYLQLKRPHHS
jgi:flavodoxin I